MVVHTFNPRDGKRESGLTWPGIIVYLVSSRLRDLVSKTHSRQRPRSGSQSYPPVTTHMYEHLHTGIFTH